MILQQCTDKLAHLLCELLNHSMRVGKVPEKWKTYVVSPILRCGSRSESQNCRPVELLLIVSKVMESLTDDVRRIFFEDGHLHDLHHEFIGHRSCQTNLIKAMDRQSGVVERRIQLHTISLDFSKTFDRMSHPGTAKEN